MRLLLKGSDSRLSKHLKQSEIDCHCNDVGCFYTLIHPVTIHCFERLRKLCNKPLKVNSGFRCQKHNKDVGGVVKSKHCLGMAIDIALPENMSLNELESHASFAGFDVVIPYKDSNFVHCQNNILED